MEKYKVFDNKENHWVKDDFYIAPNGDMFISKKMPFGTARLSKAQNERYAIYCSVDVFDMHGTRIYEGSVCKFADSDDYGVVAYAEQHASYYLFDEKNEQYYPLNAAACKQLEVIGHVRQTYGLPDQPYLIKRGGID